MVSEKDPWNITEYTQQRMDSVLCQVLDNNYNTIAYGFNLGYSLCIVFSSDKPLFEAWREIYNHHMGTAPFQEKIISQREV